VGEFSRIAAAKIAASRLAGRRAVHVPRYYFDLQDDGGIAIDEEGLELPTMQRVQEEAARSLAGMARDTLATFDNGSAREMAVAVRDEIGPVLLIRCTYQIERPRKH
jgi:hypothetical protein